MDQNEQGASLEAASFIDMAEGRSRMADSSRVAVIRGLTTDRHTWTEAVDPMAFPYVAATFRDQTGQTALHLYYALPTGQMAQATDEDTLRVDVGVALHDTAWTAAVNQAATVRLPAPEDPAVVSIQAIQLTVPPDSYHVALHARLLGTSHVGGYTFEKRVPDYRRPGLSLSDLLLAYAVTTTEGTPTSRADLRIVANPYRRFALDQLVHVYFEIYYLIYGTDDRTRYTVEYTLISQEQRKPLSRIFRPGRRSSLTVKVNRQEATSVPLEYAEIDVSQVEPGHYVLSVIVTDEISGTSVTRTTPVELYER